MAEYIEREALIAHIKDLPTWWADAGGVYGRSMKYPEGMFDCEDVISSVENAPAADVAPVRHGRWETHYHSGTTVPKGVVSGCCDMWNERKTPYCPNCGCRMDGGMEENNG